MAKYRLALCRALAAGIVDQQAFEPVAHDQAAMRVVLQMPDMTVHYPGPLGRTVQQDGVTLSAAEVDYTVAQVVEMGGEWIQ